MPFGIHKHSNRSKQALNDSAGAIHPSQSSSGQASPLTGTDEARRLTPPPPPATIQPRPQSTVYLAQSPGPDGDRDPRVYQNTGELPARSQSTRYASSAYQQQAQLHQGQAYQPGASADDITLDSRKHQHQGRGPPVQTPVAEPKKSKSLFDRMRSSSSRTAEQKAAAANANQPSYNNTTGLARRISKRSEHPPPIRTVQRRDSLEQQQQQQQQRLDWQAAQDSRTHLPSPQEGNEDDSDLDPYLVRQDQQQQSSAPSSAVQEHIQQPSIRPVNNDSEPVLYPAADKVHQQFYDQQPQPQPYNPAHHQQSDSASSSHYQLHHQGHSQQQLNIQPGSLITADPYRQQNPETVSQLSYDSPIDPVEQRPISVQSNGQSPASYAQQRQDYPNRTAAPQGPRPLSQYNTGAMPQSGQPQSNRRAADSKQTLQGSQGQEARGDAPPPNYSRQQFSGNQPPTPGLPTGGSGSGAGYRGGPPQREHLAGAAGGGEQGRSTPPPAPADRDVNDAYKELLTKYKKVKGLYFDKTAQVEQLQNTLANQRLSQSRTSLDDSEYMTRFQRLDGATTNLAFNIRKDWRTVPTWLSQHVNQDAMKIGRQEMTAVGRACITKFLMDEIFTRTFHPGLEGQLSAHLKNIEQNIRFFSPALNNVEESDALTSKIVQWRLATLEGLKDILSSPESEECRTNFTRVATTNLTASLINYLQEIPAGIEDSAHMIIELAVSIACNLPLESRDISIVYPMPGDPLQPFIMKVESGVPPLENPGAETPSDADASSTGSGDREETPKDGEKPEGKVRKDKAKSGGMLQAMMGGNSSSSGTKKGAPASQVSEASSESKGKVSSEDGPQKVRLAGFVGIEVRGRQVLGKAPVWTVN